MLSKLHLVRHGRSSHTYSSAWVDASAYQHWRDGYDSAGINVEHVPPRSLLQIVASAGCVVSSDLRRAIESAEFLTPTRPIIRSALLRETPLPIPSWQPARLPIAAWEVVTHVNWTYYVLRRNDPTWRDLERAREALSWLESLDSSTGTVVVVTHGMFRRLLRLQLQRHGWRAIRANRSYACWSVWSFARHD